MPLDEREQRILEEIERQFYETDRKLAETVSKASITGVFRRPLQWAALGFLVGLGVMLFFFTRYTPIAMVGFVLMVASAWTAAVAVRRRSPTGTDTGPGKTQQWVTRLRSKWRREG